MKVKREFLSLGKFDLGDGSQVRFWEDSWIRPHPLKSLFPALYNIVRRKNVSVRSVLSMTLLNVTFRRSVVANLQACVQIKKLEKPLCVGVTSEWVVFCQIDVQSFIRSRSYTI